MATAQKKKKSKGDSASVPSVSTVSQTKNDVTKKAEMKEKDEAKEKVKEKGREREKRKKGSVLMGKDNDDGDDDDDDAAKSVMRDRKEEKGEEVHGERGMGQQEEAQEEKQKLMEAVESGKKLPLMPGHPYWNLTKLLLIATRCTIDNSSHMTIFFEFFYVV